MTKFAQKIIRWHGEHGRHDLPWQKKKTPYRVWISEIMLQQTQVTTVIPYYLRFMQRFPDIKALASAPLDDVLAHWSGLGYYARARNLHKAAKILRAQYQGRFPKTVKEVMALPGIGRSTAGAILSFSRNVPAVILDGNVKRVLARHNAVDGWPGKKSVHDRLWDVATKQTPKEKIAIYNQAMMDLGALVCTRTAPSCTSCPVALTCKAKSEGNPMQYPGKKPKSLSRRHKTTHMLIFQLPNQRVYLERRPEKGIWGGLWSFPEVDSIQDPHEAWRDAIESAEGDQLRTVFHSFSHYDLTIHVVLYKIENAATAFNSGRWYNPMDEVPGGMAAPVQKIFQQLKENPHD